MQFTNYITSLVIPVGSGQLLLPSVAVAEILHECPLDTQLGEPDWLLGLLNWRKHLVPVISIEEIAGLEFLNASESEPRIVILYGNPENKVPYYAFKTQGMPHSLQVVKDLLLLPKEITDKPGILASVEIETRLTWLPDLDYMEEAIAEMV